MKTEFGRLRKKILRHVLIIAVIGLAVWVLLQFVLIDGLSKPERLDLPLAEDGSLFLDDVTATQINSILRQRQNAYLLAIGFLILLLAIFYYMMMRMTQYFYESSAGVDQLLTAETQPISLSPEMDFMADKLNAVKEKLRRREREATLAEQRKNDLVVYLAHDIRTPLTTVLGYLNLLRESPDMPAEKRAQYLELTLESTKRLENLINQFFEITRFNLQEIHLDVADINLTVMLRQLSEEFYPLLESRGNQLVLQVPDNLMVLGDADKLVRVFRNILKNAATYSDEGSIIRVEAKEHENAVKIDVRDTGATIPANELEAIFDKFYRLDHARSAKTGGAGLGLAIAKEIVLAHGGTIMASSGTQETIFSVSLPNSACQ